jgi:hypothetical protein
MLFYQERHVEAAQAIVSVQAYNERAGDLGRQEKSDFEEMAWVQGLFLYCAGEYERSLPHWRTVMEIAGEPRRKMALDRFINASIRLGRVHELKPYYDKLRQYEANRTAVDRKSPDGP